MPIIEDDDEWPVDSPSPPDLSEMQGRELGEMQGRAQLGEHGELSGINALSGELSGAVDGEAIHPVITNSPVMTSSLSLLPMNDASDAISSAFAPSVPSPVTTVP